MISHLSIMFHLDIYEGILVKEFRKRGEGEHFWTRLSWKPRKNISLMYVYGILIITNQKESKKVSLNRLT